MIIQMDVSLPIFMNKVIQMSLCLKFYLMICCISFELFFYFFALKAWFNLLRTFSGWKATTFGGSVSCKMGQKLMSAAVLWMAAYSNHCNRWTQGLTRVCLARARVCLCVCVCVRLEVWVSERRGWGCVAWVEVSNVGCSLWQKPT